MSDESWEPLWECSSRGAAEALAAFLQSEEIPARVEARKLVAAVDADFRVLVPKALVYRARWIVDSAEFTDPELAYIATGRLGEAEE